MADLEVGILIIGSLYWDTKPHREFWRCDRLLCDLAISVVVPIRYGRISHGRGNTFTMVFSNGLRPDRLGRALVVPCVEKLSTSNQLVNEAQSLWAAEQPGESQPGPVSASWGAVGLLVNPNRDASDEIIDGWRHRVSTERERYSGFQHAANEQPAVTAEGLLTVPWPDTASGVALELDALLATATQPSLTNGNYATPDVIAAAWRRAPEHRNYFNENRRAGITTFEDEEIVRHLAPSTA